MHKQLHPMGYFNARRFSAGLVSAIAALTLDACSTVDLSVRDEPESRPLPTPPNSTSTASATPVKPPSVEEKKPGGYYKDDGPADSFPD